MPTDTSLTADRMRRSGKSPITVPVFSRANLLIQSESQQGLRVRHGRIHMNSLVLKYVPYNSEFRENIPTERISVTDGNSDAKFRCVIEGVHSSAWSNTDISLHIFNRLQVIAKLDRGVESTDSFTSSQTRNRVKGHLMTRILNATETALEVAVESATGPGPGRDCVMRGCVARPPVFLTAAVLRRFPSSSSHQVYVFLES